MKMKKTTFSLPGMGCAAEERLVRMALARRTDVRRIEADLSTRRIQVVHEGDVGHILTTLLSLNLGLKHSPP